MTTFQQVTFGCGHTATTTDESVIIDARLGVLCPSCLLALGQAVTEECAADQDAI